MSNSARERESERERQSDRESERLPIDAHIFEKMVLDYRQSSKRMHLLSGPPIDISALSYVAGFGVDT